MMAQAKPSSSEKFRWPPEKSEPKSHKLVPIQIRLPNRMIESIEVHLLGRTGMAFDRWASRTGWRHDGLDVYCWRCGGSIGSHESDGDGCATCRSTSLPWDRAIRLSRYHKTIREEILSLKFGSWRPTGDGLGMHLGHAIAEQLEHAQISKDHALLVPVPMHRLRRIARGVDHTLVLAKAAAQSSGCRVSSMLSTRYRPEQVGLSKTARAKNIRDAFYVSKLGRRRLGSALAKECRVVILVDDVRTTGATFVAATKSLKSAFQGEFGMISDPIEPPQIWVACLGVAGEPQREPEEGINDAQR